MFQKARLLASCNTTARCTSLTCTTGFWDKGRANTIRDSVWCWEDWLYVPWSNIERCYEMTPISFLFTFTLLFSCHVIVMWSHSDSLFLWRLLFHHIYCSVTHCPGWLYCPCDGYCSCDSIVLIYYKYWQSLALQPQTWLLYLTVQTRNQSPFPTLIPLSLLSQGYLF